ncbi:coiled-coil domain-containing protein 88B isoform X2 [Rhineura floridana]|uniref:coiled-coil domain-containing protein 88B isoform X2 n=1 Tax=Rhineura floridana TaxID=261503 RepID=UPI002AC834D7|nr:coiled-coil domain-containing protein 88B isoform X2 [Rhineura floridana]
MDGDMAETLEEFVSGPLVTWVQTLEALMDSRSDQPPSPLGEKRHGGPQEYFLKLVGGDFLIHIMEIIDLIPGGAQPPWREQSDEAQRLQMLQTVLQRLRKFYQNDSQQLILSSPPNVYLLARDPLTAQAVGEMKKLMLLLLGSAVQCERRDEIIGLIQTLDIGTQAALASAIQEVTQEPKNVLRLQWKQLGPSEMEELLWNMVSRTRELVHERDAGLEKLWELQEGRELPPVPPPESCRQHLGVQLAESRAQVRRLQHELEEKMEELLDQEDELKNLERQLQKLRQENRELVGKARLTGQYQDELDALKEKTLRMERLQAELTALRERLPALEQCRAQLREEREFSQALLETKAMLEGKLEAARTQGKHLNQLEKERLRLQSCLSQTQEEQDQLYHQTEELLRENLALKSQLRRSLGESLNALRAEEIERDWAPDEPFEGPVLLSCEVKEAGRLLALERENQDLRRQLEEALEDPSKSRDLEAESKNAVLDEELESRQSRVEPEAGKQAADLTDCFPEAQKQREGKALAPERRASQGLRQETEAALSEARTLLREAEHQQEAESRGAMGLEDRLRSLQEAHANTLEEREGEHERWRLETERLVEEVQALEREQAALRAGSQALQAAATLAELELGEARQSLQGERLQGAQLAQKARRLEEDLCEARREMEGLQRSLEQQKVTLPQMEVEKGALGEMLSQAEDQRRQLEKANRRLKAQTQAQEEALAAQGLHLVHLEAQSRQQATELGSLREATQRLRELEQECASLREQLDSKREASAILEEELQKEKAEGKEREAILAQLREQLLKKEESPQVGTQSRPPSQEKQEEHSNGKELELEGENSALRRQLEELHAFKQQHANNGQDGWMDGWMDGWTAFKLIPTYGNPMNRVFMANSSLAVPLLSEEPPVTQGTEGQSEQEPDLLPFQVNTRSEALSARIIEVERRNAVLQAEKSALTGHLGQLESQVGSLQVALLGLQAQSADAKEESGRWQAQNSTLQAEATSLRSQQALLESQLLELRQRLSVLEAEVRGVQQEREEWRGRYDALLRDHDRLTVLHERQGADLEGLLGKHVSLKGALRGLEQEHREVQARHRELLGQKAGLEQREAKLQGQKDSLEEAERDHQGLVAQHSSLKEEHERVKQALAQAERAWDDLQGELRGTRNRVTSLQLEQARLEAESTALTEQNRQLDMALGRLSTQCELLGQLKGNQEEENRHLLQEIQALSRENRHLLEHSMESREHFQEEQRQYLDKLGELRREKQKLVEKIMDQYRVLEPALPRGKKSNWITEKIRKLMKTRREAPREQLRPMAEGAGSSESLTGQEGHGADGTVSSTPGSPAPLHKASSTLSILDAQQVHFRRHRLSSRMPVVEHPGEAQDTPRQRFRQRRLGMLGGSHEEAAAVAAAAEWEIPSQISTSDKEERGEIRGPPMGEEEQGPKCLL